MTPDKKKLFDSLFRKVQMAHIQGVIELHHAPSLEQTLESYRRVFQIPIASRAENEHTQCVHRFMQAEVPAVADILTECHVPDKQKTLSNLEARPELLNRMPLITDFLAQRREGSA